jgi:hypothetical protein
MQDTVPIHSAIISQRVALGALAEGRPWLDAQMAALRQNRRARSSIKVGVPLK